ncbi:precorrin-8X methylmutase [Fodinicurvata sediminis]|uniref:precorrin-8X methylmutase n=1 Tax=Fodinicurvata sediminis TaxID=1121832 RepID=UPI00047AA415
MPQRDYLRDPAAIYQKSFETVRQEAVLAHLPTSVHGLVVRMIHACGMVDIAEDIRVEGNAAAAGASALRSGKPVLVDCEMLAHGIIGSRLPAGNKVVCSLNDPSVPTLAGQQQTTRSAAAVELWGSQLDGAVVAIGNAPTALFRLIELLEEGAPQPAAIIAAPVGFVGAVESKQALVDASLGIPFVTLLGRRGGSAITAAGVNALAGEWTQ